MTAEEVGTAISVWVSFTDDAGNPEAATSPPTEAVAPRPPLTAQFLGTPASHDGQSEFIFELRFSESPRQGFSYETLRDHAFTVTGGEVVRARRLEKDQNVRWEIHVRPDSNAAATIVLPATTACGAEGAICTEDGRMLSSSLELNVEGPDGQVRTRVPDPTSPARWTAEAPRQVPIPEQDRRIRLGCGLSPREEPAMTRAEWGEKVMERGSAGRQERSRRG